MRSVKEWVGRTDDSKPPPRVALRIFERWDGVSHRSGRKIMAGEAWDLDHIQALCNGGKNRESNLAPILRSEHKDKTKEDVAEKAEVNRKRQKHLGIKTVKQPIQSRGFAKAEKVKGSKHQEHLQRMKAKFGDHA